ncbi:unnamed protein product [Peronospora effusa]|uniref:RxLR effector protein n=1 Tax=Peronospora effusa TaxID=542832 RepID=A0A3M6VCB4_9STRA|nr:hypothetical protein DD238_007727 [Peronospora effusa]RQM16461.1 hypothetical protein DD237_004679 [Peronospora effusa]CAI5714670.1 unnamed protein product [Peronospora effusa]
MRFNILVAPVVAAFVASCSCFVSAEVAALDGYTHDGKEVVRRLRKDSDVQEERGPKESILSAAEKVKGLFPGKTSVVPESEPLLKAEKSAKFQPPDNFKITKESLQYLENRGMTLEQYYKLVNKETPRTNNGETVPSALPILKENMVSSKTLSTDRLEEFVTKLKPNEKQFLEERKINLELVKQGDTNEVIKVMNHIVGKVHSTKEVVRQLFESLRKLANNRATIVLVSTTIAPPSDS